MKCHTLDLNLGPMVWVDYSYHQTIEAFVARVRVRVVYIQVIYRHISAHSYECICIYLHSISTFIYTIYLHVSTQYIYMYLHSISTCIYIVYLHVSAQYIYMYLHSISTCIYIVSTYRDLSYRYTIQIYTDTMQITYRYTYTDIYTDIYRWTVQIYIDIMQI